MPCAQSRFWTFTLQAEEESERVAWPLATEENLPLENPDPEVVQGLFYQVERAPTTGQLHLQGFIVLKKKGTFNAVKALFPGAHIERARGTQQQNIDYCSKSETKVCGPFTVGELERPGHEKPFEECCSRLKAGSTIHDLVEEFAPQVARHSRNFEALQRYMVAPAPAWRTLHVVWYWGKTEVGKTRRCYAEEPGLFKVHSGGQWWDGYSNQDAILFDEFYGDIKMKEMLNYLDGYRLTLPVKGGFVEAHWTKVFITSDTDPHDLYRSVPEPVREAFFRRIHVIEEMTE